MKDGFPTTLLANYLWYYISHKNLNTIYLDGLGTFLLGLGDMSLEFEDDLLINGAKLGDKENL